MTPTNPSRDPSSGLMRQARHVHTGAELRSSLNDLPDLDEHAQQERLQDNSGQGAV